MNRTETPTGTGNTFVIVSDEVEREIVTGDVFTPAELTLFDYDDVTAVYDFEAVRFEGELYVLSNMEQPPMFEAFGEWHLAHYTTHTSGVLIRLTGDQGGHRNAVVGRWHLVNAEGETV